MARFSPHAQDHPRWTGRIGEARSRSRAVFGHEASAEVSNELEGFRVGKSPPLLAIVGVFIHVGRRKVVPRSLMRDEAFGRFDGTVPRQALPSSVPRASVDRVCSQQPVAMSGYLTPDQVDDAMPSVVQGCRRGLVIPRRDVAEVTRTLGADMVLKVDVAKLAGQDQYLPYHSLSLSPLLPLGGSAPQSFSKRGSREGFTGADWWPCCRGCSILCWGSFDG
ncbi:hypothetical protein B296_00024137 [Ensete ventricosum]|uniref:Uncharacterized protein n=1 Tax=Ensete ventricosum TaxID=4639 RepID=A0A426YPS3_ENSVE|nr:hypothetical protein B296_00024137 [Ensete ventricosum]